MHLAETRAELELLADGTGEFRELLTDFGIWRDDRSQFGQRPMDYLEILSQAPRSLIIHGNFLVEVELKYLASRPQMTLVYCPRTHAAFGHSEHPWRRLRELGGRVAIGTDSRASNPDLSLFAELQLVAANNPDLSHVELLQLGSSAGREALGIGKPNVADFTLIRLKSNCNNGTGIVPSQRARSWDHDQRPVGLAGAEYPTAASVGMLSLRSLNPAQERTPTFTRLLGHPRLPNRPLCGLQVRLGSVSVHRPDDRSLENCCKDDRKREAVTGPGIR